jgi:hypothetical protein
MSCLDASYTKIARAVRRVHTEYSANLPRSVGCSHHRVAYELSCQRNLFETQSPYGQEIAPGTRIARRRSEEERWDMLFVPE